MADKEIAALPRDSCPVRIRNRCVMTSRPRGVKRRWRLSRIIFRHLADNNQMSGVLRARWWPAILRTLQSDWIMKKIRRAEHQHSIQTCFGLLVFRGIYCNERVPPLPTKAWKVLMFKVNPLRLLQHIFSILYMLRRTWIYPFCRWCLSRCESCFCFLMGLGWKINKYIIFKEKRMMWLLRGANVHVTYCTQKWMNKYCTLLTFFISVMVFCRM